MIKVTGSRLHVLCFVQMVVAAAARQFRYAPENPWSHLTQPGCKAYKRPDAQETAQHKYTLYYRSRVLLVPEHGGLAAASGVFAVASFSIEL